MYTIHGGSGGISPSSTITTQQRAVAKGRKCSPGARTWQKKQNGGRQLHTASTPTVGDTRSPGRRQVEKVQKSMGKLCICNRAKQEIRASAGRDLTDGHRRRSTRSVLNLYGPLGSSQRQFKDSSSPKQV